MKTEHIELLETLKQAYGTQSRSKVLEMLLDDLLKTEETISDEQLDQGETISDITNIDIACHKSVS